MMVPDYTLIAEIMLYRYKLYNISFGFKEAEILAKKLVQAFKLSSELLSS